MSKLPDWVSSESEHAGRGPTARRVWGGFGLGVVGGLLAGILVDGISGDFSKMRGAEVYRTVIGGGIVGPALLLFAGALMVISKSVRVPVLPRVVLWLAAAGAGLSAGLAVGYDVTGPPPQDMGRAVSSSQAMLAAVLFGVALVAAIYLSTRRFGAVEQERPVEEPAKPTPAHTRT